jgi:hypothetical protein
MEPEKFVGGWEAVLAGIAKEIGVFEKFAYHTILAKAASVAIFRKSLILSVGT